MISASLVKELREKTGAGMMDCKKALTECNGDINAAADWLREKGIAKAAKKATRIAAEGLCDVVIAGNKAYLYELNSETDFVAKNEKFLHLLQQIGVACVAADAACEKCALAATVDGQTVEELIVAATATIGEKISLRRLAVVEKADDEINLEERVAKLEELVATLLKDEAETEEEIEAETEEKEVVDEDTPKITKSEKVIVEVDNVPKQSNYFEMSGRDPLTGKKIRK